MSSTTLVNLEKLNEREEPLSSGTPTPVRNSVEVTRDEEKVIDDPIEPDNVANPPPLSKVRTGILMLGLCLSMFLVALDFVGSSFQFH